MLSIFGAPSVNPFAATVAERPISHIDIQTHIDDAKAAATDIAAMGQLNQASNLLARAPHLINIEYVSEIAALCIRRSPQKPSKSLAQGVAFAPLHTLLNVEYEGKSHPSIPITALILGQILEGTAERVLEPDDTRAAALDFVVCQYDAAVRNGTINAAFWSQKADAKKMTENGIRSAKSHLKIIERKAYSDAILAVTKTQDIGVWKQALGKIKDNPSLLDPDDEEQLILWSLDKDDRTFRRVSKLICALISPKNEYLTNHIFTAPKEARLWMLSPETGPKYTKKQFQRAEELRAIIDRSLQRKRERGLFTPSADAQ